MRLLCAISVLAAWAGASGAMANVMTFDALAVGTRWGQPGNRPGDLIHTEDGIRATVETFVFTGTGSTFNFTDVRNDPTNFATNYLNVNNINLSFDFAALGFTPARVTFEYIDQGGFENLSVNGGTLYRGELTACPATWGAVSVSISPPIPIPSGFKRRVTLIGPVSKFTVGGQEFGIDTVEAVRPCGADFNGDGVVGIQDVFDFLTAYFAALP